MSANANHLISVSANHPPQHSQQLNVPQQVAFLTPSTVANRLWRHYQTQLNHGTKNDVTVIAGHYSLIGEDGLHFISEQYSEMIAAPVAVSQDEFSNIRIQPLYEPLGRASASDKVPVSASSNPNEGKNWRGKLPRPPNSFILYRQHHHPLLKAKNPGFHNNQISLILGKQWRSESEEVKAHFKYLAEELKKKHLRDHPDYQYQPRKPSEKKRRMTRRKAEALALNSRGRSDTTTMLQRINDGLEVDPVEICEDYPVQQLETTKNANLVLNLGDDGLDGATLESLLQSSNDHLSQTTLMQGNRYPNWNTPALYSEPTQGTQDEHNFYSGINDASLVYGDLDNDVPTDAQLRLAEHQYTVQQMADQYNDKYKHEESIAELMDKYTTNFDEDLIDPSLLFDF